MNQRPAGLLDSNSIEFFVCENLQAYKLKAGTVVPFERFGDDLLEVVQLDMNKHPRKLAELTKMGVTEAKERIKQYLVCNYGGFDNNADVVNGELQPTEYWACPKRGTCRHEGVLCDSLRTQTGQHLTKTEILVLQQIALGKLDKEIADHLVMALFTVTTHTRNIRIKTGLGRKPELVRFAIERNLI